MFAIRDESDHFERKIQKQLYRFPCLKGKTRVRYNYSGCGSDVAKKFRIQLDPDPQHWWLRISFRHINTGTGSLLAGVVRFTEYQCWGSVTFWCGSGSRIRTFDYWIRIQLRIRFLSSVIVRMQKNIF
jgi:hypothetical protein